ncbi:unnamed protein product [Strongylus vulgaris]|uniref:Uncharacterized protein n=1 Tax=Strongylus vulgaris TaxID=40348 RepID=A0A3P7KSL9_STRVU|nr:unnamed protein product [Strongylus vulgaris]
MVRKGFRTATYTCSMFAYALATEGVIVLFSGQRSDPIARVCCSTTIAAALTRYGYLRLECALFSPCGVSGLTALFD